MLQTLSIIIGLLIGSFLTVCVYRIPYGRPEGPGDFGTPLDEEEEEEEEQAQAAEEAESEEGRHLTLTDPPRSFCPRCEKQLLWWHNIPVLSWLLLRGRCGWCSEPIPVTYPLIEVLTVLTAFLCIQFFDLATAVALFVFCCALIVISFIDIKYYIIPDVITYPAMIVGGVLAVVNHFWQVLQAPFVQSVQSALWGLLAGGGFLYVVSMAYVLIRRKEGLGLGDVKLLAVIGILFGPEAAMYTIFFGSFAGSLLGGALLLLLRERFSKPLPFGPYLVLGAYLYFFVGPDLPRHLITGLAELMV